MKEWTPISPRGGGLVHMTSLSDPHRTACNKICAGWQIALAQVDCSKCKAAVHYPVKAPVRKKL